MNVSNLTGLGGTLHCQYNSQALNDPFSYFIEKLVHSGMPRNHASKTILKEPPSNINFVVYVKNGGRNNDMVQTGRIVQLARSFRDKGCLNQLQPF